MTQLRVGHRPHPMTPLPAPGPGEELIASGTLSQSFEANKSDVFSVIDARRLGLWLTHTPHGSQSGGYVVVQVLISPDDGTAGAPPTIGADQWYAPTLSDSTPTDADIAAGVTLVTGADYGKAPEWRTVKCGGLLLRTMDTDASEPVRIKLPSIDVGEARWAYVAMIQQGDTTNFGTAALRGNLAL